MLRRAGFAQPDALSLFLSLKLGAALACGTAAALWATGTEDIAQHLFLVTLAGLAGHVAGSIVREYVLRALVARRTRNMSAALPDALDLMVMCLESGLTFERAIITVAEGRDAPDEDKEAIVAFINTLAGESKELSQ